MTLESGAAPGLPAASLAAAWDLARQAREARDDRELGFLLANGTRALLPYRQAVLWLGDAGVFTLSGAVQVEANAPYVQWVESVCRHLRQGAAGGPVAFTAADLPQALAEGWADWWPAHALWMPHGLPAPGGQGGQDAGAPAGGGVLWLREDPWSDGDLAALGEWLGAWWHAFEVLHRPRLRTLAAWRTRARRLFAPRPGQPWHRQPRVRLALLAVAVLALPVRLSVLAPGELVPAHPIVLRSPLDGTIDIFHVQPNQKVAKDQPLFGFDEALIHSRLEVARQTLATAETDYRQTAQQALSDARAKSQLALLAGRAEERRAEVAYLDEQLKRARVLAPQAGVVLMDDPAEWIGRPVTVGERILRIAAEGDVEVEAWLPLADAITLAPGAKVNLYLNASPLSPVSAQLRYLAHDAVQRPDGGYAYRVRAALDGKTGHRVGLKGTARIHGRWVPLAYWLLRRPWAGLRAYLGV